MLLDENIPDLPSEPAEPPTEREAFLDTIWDLVEENILEARDIAYRVDDVEELFDNLIADLWNEYIRFYKV